MKSGLEGRNNTGDQGRDVGVGQVSMKSGLEGRNNPPMPCTAWRHCSGLNEVRPRRPEQSENQPKTT